MTATIGSGLADRQAVARLREQERLQVLEGDLGTRRADHGFPAGCVRA